MFQPTGIDPSQRSRVFTAQAAPTPGVQGAIPRTLEQSTRILADVAASQPSGHLESWEIYHRAANPAGEFSPHVQAAARIFLANRQVVGRAAQQSRGRFAHSSASGGSARRYRSEDLFGVGAFLDGAERDLCQNIEDWVGGLVGCGPRSREDRPSRGTSGFDHCHEAMRRMYHYMGGRRHRRSMGLESLFHLDRAGFGPAREFLDCPDLLARLFTQGFARHMGFMMQDLEEALAGTDLGFDPEAFGREDPDWDYGVPEEETDEADQAGEFDWAGQADDADMPAAGAWRFAQSPGHGPDIQDVTSEYPDVLAQNRRLAEREFQNRMQNNLAAETRAQNLRHQNVREAEVRRAAQNAQYVMQENRRRENLRDDEAAHEQQRLQQRRLDDQRLDDQRLDDQRLEDERRDDERARRE